MMWKLPRGWMLTSKVKQELFVETVGRPKNQPRSYQREEKRHKKNLFPGTVGFFAATEGS